MLDCVPGFGETCGVCGQSVDGQTYWIEDRSYPVHTRCRNWSVVEKPPYLWLLVTLRKQYGQATGKRRERILEAGRAIREMEREWPRNAVMHVERVVEAARWV